MGTTHLREGVVWFGDAWKLLKQLAPQVGLEPTTLRLTADPLVAASRCKHNTYARERQVFPEFGGTLGVLLRGLEDARRLVEGYVAHYNNVRLNSAIGYVTPKDMLAGRQQEILAQRDRKLEAARQQRQIRRQRAA
jgi:hypothetical protein